MNFLSAARQALKENNATCALYFSAEHAEKYALRLYFDRGIRPLFAALDDGLLAGAYVADRVIGKSAAMLLIKGGVREIDTEAISSHAKKLLDAYQIPYSYRTECEYIINHRGDGMCPMESAVLGVTDIDEGVRILRQTAAKLFKPGN